MPGKKLGPYFFVLIGLLLSYHPVFSQGPDEPCSGTSDVLTPHEIIASIESVDRILASSKECFSNDQMNFGVLTYNKYFKIYRSTGLGKEGLLKLKNHLSQNRLACPSKIIYMNRYGYKTSLKSKFVDLFRGSKLYKGQFALQQSESATSGKIVEVKGQQQETPQKDCTQLTEESDLVESQEGQPSSLSDDTDTGRFYFQFIDPISHNVYLEAKRKGEGSILGRYTDGFKMGTETRTGGREAFYEVLKQILTHHGAVDFHCKGGIHRTGMVGLMIRYLQGGEWTKELTQPFHTTAKRGNLLKKDLALQLRNEAEKEYRDHNPNNFRQENLQTIRELSQDSLFECLKTEFSPYLNADSLEPVKTQCIRNGAYSEASTTNRDLPDDLSEKMRSEMWKKCWDQHNKELSISVEIDHLEGLLEKYQLEFSKKGKLEKLKALLKKDTQKELLKEKITQLYSKIRDRVFHSSTDISEHRLEVLKNRFCSFKKQIPPLKPPEFTSIMGAVGDNCASYGAP